MKTVSLGPEEFLLEWATVDDLKALLWSYELPRSGDKRNLVGRLVTESGVPFLALLCSLNNEVLRGILRASGLSGAGTKSGLVVRIVESRLVTMRDTDIVSFLETLGSEELTDYGRLVLLASPGSVVQRLPRLLPKVSKQQLSLLSKAVRGVSPEESNRTLVRIMSSAAGDLPCYASYLLEELIESKHSIRTAATTLAQHEDSIRAHHRKIIRSCQGNPDLHHPAVDELLRQIWTGETLHTESIVSEVRQEIRKGTKDVQSAVEALRGESPGSTIDEIRGTTATIEHTTRKIRQDLRLLEQQLREIRSRVDESPDKVAEALRKLLASKEIGWRARSRIKRDLKRFANLVDYAQKVEFLGRAIATYGPVVISAVRALV